LPGGLSALGSGAFFGCGSLESISLPGGVTTIEDAAFSDCGSLRGVNLSAGLRDIGEEAFARCGALTSITLPEGLVTIGQTAFIQCTNLVSITLPGSLTTIGPMAFSGCRALSSPRFLEGLTTIGYLAFGTCASLTAVTLPVSLTGIGAGAFAGCGKLRAITLLNPEPPQLPRGLWDSPDESPARIYVPAAAREAYQTAPGWENHADRIQAAPWPEEEPAPAGSAEALQRQVEVLRELSEIIGLLEKPMQGLDTAARTAIFILMLRAYELMEQVGDLPKNPEDGTISEDALEYLREQLGIE
jgi:hypothetical protein